MRNWMTNKATVSKMLAVMLFGGFAMSMPLAEINPVAAQEAPQAMPVTVQTVSLQNVKIWKSFSGRMEAVDYAEIRPRASGTIMEVRFQDGQQVEKGDVLFVVDPRPYEASLQQARAELQAAETELTFAELELERAQGLIKNKNISQRVFDERANRVLVAKAQASAARASVSQAAIDRDYAYVKAPISGRISRAEITVGNLVSAGAGAPLLTSIVSDQGIYADFNVDETTYLQQIRTSARTKREESEIPVEIYTDDEGAAQLGFIHAFDNRIDASSGTIRARAYFPNTDGSLLPGMFVQVRIASNEESGKILVDEKAIGTNQDRKFVYVAGDDNILGYREVTLGDHVGKKRVITSGLNPGDKVVTEGVIRLRPGMPVAPQEAETDNG